VGTHEADILVIALGADYDVATTPGIILGRNEFYSVPGAVHLGEVLPTFKRGHAVIGVCAAPYKCPPAPSECALMLHDYLLMRGLRRDCHITLVNPLPGPVPPSPETSKALIAAFAERNIEYLPSRRVASAAEADCGRTPTPAAPAAAGLQSEYVCRADPSIGEEFDREYEAPLRRAELRVETGPRA